MKTDTEILLASQAEARRVLELAVEEAASIMRDAGEEAAVLLADQKRLAAELVTDEKDLADQVADAVTAEAAGMSNGETDQCLHEQARRANALLARQERLAAELLEAEAVLARSSHAAVSKAGCALLLNAHREAAAILLEAKMKVESRQ